MNISFAGLKGFSPFTLFKKVEKHAASPHQGAREMARRRRQIAAGSLRFANGVEASALLAQRLAA